MYVELKKKYDHIVYKRKEKIAYKYVLNNSFFECAETKLIKKLNTLMTFMGD